MRASLARRIVDLRLGTPYFLATVPRLTAAWTTVPAAAGDVKDARVEERILRHVASLLALYPALWLFALEEGVAPTNNHAERVQRRAVLWRRKSFGCQSPAGCRFVERILTVVQTLRLQSRNTLEFLGQTIAAHRFGSTQPTLCQIG